MTAEAYRPISYLESNASRRPGALAMWDAGEEISFASLLGEVSRTRRWLGTQGVRAGDVVGVQLPNVWQYVALEIAIPDIGAVILPLPLTLGEHELGWIREKAKPALMVTTSDLGDGTDTP